MSRTDEDVIEDAQRIGYMYIGPFIMTAGIIGSLANLITLQNKKFTGRLYVYLKALSIADLGFLCFAASNMIGILESHSNDHELSLNQMFYKAHLELGITNSFIAASVFIIVSMNLDRYYAICRPSEYQHSRAYTNPWIDVGLAFLCGTIVQVPWFFAKTVKRLICVEPEVNLSNLGRGVQDFQPRWDIESNSVEMLCQCVEDLPTDYHPHDNATLETECEYSIDTIEKLSSALIWQTYVILSETFIRFGPSALLLLLNFLMIRDFNLSIQRKKTLRAAWISPTSKIASDGDTIATIEDTVTQPHPENQMRKKSSIFKPLFSVSDLTSRLRNNDTTPPAMTTTMVDVRRRSMAPSMKERNVIVILAVISIVFATCNIPQAICRILNVPKRSKDVNFQIFRVTSNLMELTCASLNFYLYCLCNHEIRSRVVKIFTCWRQLRPSARETFRLK